MSPPHTPGTHEADIFSALSQSHPQLFAFLLTALLIWILPALTIGLLFTVTRKDPPAYLFKLAIHSPGSVAIVLTIFSAPFMAYGIPVHNSLLRSNWLLPLIFLVGLFLYVLFYPDKFWELLSTDSIFKDLRS
jgi:hypothetical protein